MKFSGGKTSAIALIAFSLAFLIIASSFARQEKTSLVYKEDFFKAAHDQSLFGKLIDFAKSGMASVINPSHDEILISATFQEQEHPVTCEIASLRMALNYLGEPVDEDDLIDKLNFSTTLPRSDNGTWGDPDAGFVGSVDGAFSQGTGYGVYDEPIEKLASEYRNARILPEANLSQVLKEVNKRNPVIVWGLLSDTGPVYWKTPDGKTIKAYPGEHARVVIGYSGDITKPSSIILLDPLYGKVKMSTEKFLADWRKLDNQAVVIY